MKKPKLFKSFALALTAAMIVNCTQGQDPRYTQEYNAPLRLNPALMGPNTHLKGILNYRSQWGNIDKGYTTYRFTFLYPLMMSGEGKLNAGLSAVNDVAGAFTTLNISLALGYSLSIAESHYLSAALIGGFGQKALDAQSQTYDEQYVLGSYDATNPSNETIWNEQRSYPDLGFGLLWYMDPEADLSPFAGVSLAHYNKPDESLRGGESDYPVLYNYHGGLKIMGEKFDFKPNVRISSHQGAKDYSAGTYVDFKINESMKINGGLWYRYRTQNSFAAMLGFEHSYFFLAYSYDMASFEMSKYITGSSTHEITLAFTLDRQKNTGSKPMAD